VIGLAADGQVTDTTLIRFRIQVDAVSGPHELHRVENGGHDLRHLPFCIPLKNLETKDHNQSIA
jgi:hypothetical protein